MRNLFVPVLLTALIAAAGCGGNSTGPSSKTTTTGNNSGNNVMAIAVNGGPTANQAGGSIYKDAAFASVTVCVPGSTSNCATINNLLVDTGSYGLRVFQSEVSSLNLPTLNASNGSAAYNCVSFVDGSYMWGSVEQADVTLGGETASKVPIQVISSASNVPSSCSNGSPSSLNDDNAEALGANGILGVGLEPTDCYYGGTNYCSPAAGSPPQGDPYYTCSGSTCNPALILQSNQVANPVALFPTDNNGVIVELPSVPGGAAKSVSGSVIFGIGTESNNQIPSSATIFTLACDMFTTVYDNQAPYGPNAECGGPGSFIDSGSNGMFFPNPANIQTCPQNSPVGDISSYYCPASTETLTATNEGQNGASKATSFTVANAEDLFTSPTTDSDAAMAGLAGVNPQGYGFDWGLPFFFGTNVYVSIDGQPMPAGAPPGPWWAY